MRWLIVIDKLSLYLGLVDSVCTRLNRATETDGPWLNHLRAAKNSFHWGDYLAARRFCVVTTFHSPCSNVVHNHVSKHDGGRSWLHLAPLPTLTPARSFRVHAGAGLELEVGFSFSNLKIVYTCG